MTRVISFILVLAVITGAAWLAQRGGEERAVRRVIRDGQAIFSANATQNIALLKTQRGWRISGGDVPQLEQVIGNWPPR
jgi:hypothetical protein